MKRSHARAGLDKRTTQLKIWETYVSTIGPEKTVQVSKLLLSNLGGNDREWNIETLALATLREDFPDRFEDESPDAEVLQQEIPFRVQTTGRDVTGYVVFHDGRYWFGSERFVPSKDN